MLAPADHDDGDHILQFLRFHRGRRSDHSPILHHEFTLESSSAAIARLPQRHPDLDGVFASSNLIANGALRVPQVPRGECSPSRRTGTRATPASSAS